MSTTPKKKQVVPIERAHYKPHSQRLRQSAVELMRSLHDVGNGLRIVARYGQILRLNADVGRWILWDGRRFSTDRSGEAFRLATESAQALLDQSAKYELSPSDSTKVNRWVDSSQSVRAIRAALAAASNQKTPDGICIRVAGSDLNRNPMQLNLLNGTFDLATRTLRSHDPSDAITHLAPVKFDPMATDGSPSLGPVLS
jgi:putative DNA primase/helicase